MAAIIAIGSAKEKPTAPTLTLPLDALSTDGVEPEVGDEIEHSIKGKVTKISGETATVALTELDGSPIEGSAAEEAAESPEEESSEEESEGAPSSKKNPGNPGPLGAGNPLMAALAPARARSRAQTKAIGAALRKRARGQPLPLM
jgi:hypothetical protein